MDIEIFGFGIFQNEGVSFTARRMVPVRNEAWNVIFSNIFGFVCKVRYAVFVWHGHPYVFQFGFKSDYDFIYNGSLGVAVSASFARENMYTFFFAYFLGSTYQVYLSNEINTVKTGFLCQFIPAWYEIAGKKVRTVDKENRFVADFYISLVFESL